MKEYKVLVPIAGYAIIILDAENEENAKKLALEEVEMYHIERWAGYEKIIEGNVFYPTYREMEIECTYDYDEEGE